jgi:hypothetical protein
MKKVTKTEIIIEGRYGYINKEYNGRTHCNISEVVPSREKQIQQDTLVIYKMRGRYQLK